MKVFASTYALMGPEIGILRMSAQSPELQSQIALWRSKALDGTITLDEMREAIKLMRQGRYEAQSAAAKSKTKSSGPKAAPRSAEEMLKDLGL